MRQSVFRGIFLPLSLLIVGLTLIFFVMALWVSVNVAKADPWIACYNPQPTDPVVETYNVEITNDNGQLVANPTGLVPVIGAAYSFILDFATITLPDGTYSYRSQACNQWGCSAWVSGTDSPFVKAVPVLREGGQIVRSQDGLPR